MKTLQEHYNAINIGQGNKAQFVKQARSLFPEYFNQYTNYDNTISVLKSKQIISEAAGGVVAKGFDIYDWKKILAEETKSVEKETFQFVDPTTPKNSFVNFFSKRFNVNLILKPSITLIIFKVHRDGHIDNIKNWMEQIDKLLDKKKLKIIHFPPNPA